MANPPQLDGRRANDIREDIAALAPYYLEDWDPGAGGVGAGLVDVFGELGAEVTERLDAVPTKQRVAFFDALGFSVRPPQAARVPVQYTVAPDAPRNVPIAAGTAAIAGAGEEVTFHVGGADAFEATATRLTDVIAVDPERDRIVDQGDLIDGGDPAHLWCGANEQRHAWFIGDDELLSAGAGDEIVLDVTTDVAPTVLKSDVDWHYFGTASAEEGECWRPMTDPLVESRETDRRTIVLAPGGDLVEHAVDGVESKWLRCRLPPGTAPSGSLTFTVDRIGMTVSSAGGPGHPDALLANDVPQENPAPPAEPIRPFGDEPRPGDRFYIGSETALTKAGARVTLTLEWVADSEGPNSAETSTDGGQPLRTDETVGDPHRGVIAEAENVRHVYESAEMAEGGLVATVEGDQSGSGSNGDNPILSWEYWDGDAWSRIPQLTDRTAGFTDRSDQPGTVRFHVPDDLAPTTVAGHEGHWIRVRLVGGSYGRVVYVAESDNEERWARSIRGSPPAFTEITLDYQLHERQPPAHLRTHNALAATEQSPNVAFRPFRPLSESEQTLYLGFDGPLEGGPLQLFGRVDEHAYPAGFTPRVRWERHQADGAAWTRINAQDDTAGLTEQGILGMAFDASTRAIDLFGRERHWVRARVTGDPFDPAAIGERTTDGPAEGPAADGGDGVRACGTTIDTEHRGGEPSPAPPTVTGLHMNTGWARNLRRIEGELLGGSNGEGEQVFDTRDRPALDADVWVDEHTALGEPQRESLLADRPGDVEIERTGDGDIRAVWVRWREVPDLLDSAPTDRHFACDPTGGTIQFGDGERGRIPPRGTDNLRISYRTGGGAAGNVPVGAVEELKSGLPFVEAITNPAPGAGGADRESRDGVLSRAPQQLRDRGRAVIPADYERVAADASRRVARAECIPAMDAAGEYAPGMVTVLVVPRAHGETPIPSLGLLDRVESVLSDRAPVTVQAGDRLVVRGPSYVSVSVRADIVAGDVGSLGALEERIRTILGEFLHPLTGRDGAGWAFGELPTRSDLFALLEGIAGVDHVPSLVLTFGGNGSVTVGEGDPHPSVGADTLIRGASHDLGVTLGGAD